MHSRRQIILVTGFGPFPGVPANASSELVPRLAEVADARLAGYGIATAILPTEWRGAPHRVLELYDELRPALAVHFGVSPRTDGFCVEVRGQNRCAPILDACGEAPPAAALALAGPDQLPATLPVHHVVARLRARGLPAQLSRDAGGYICNALLYRALEHARRHHPGMRIGFVHIPDTLAARRGVGGRRTRQISRLDLEDAVTGGLEILATSLGRPLMPRQRPQAVPPSPQS